MKKIPLLVGLLLLAGIALAACQPTGQTPAVNNDGDSDVISGHEATVESLQVLILESFPVQVRVIVNGYLPDGCVQLDEIMVEQSGNAFTLALNTLRPSGEVECTQALVPFEENVALDVYGLAAGTYTVTAQDQTATFKLDVDNVPQLPDPDEGAGTNVYLDSMTVNIMESFPVQVSITLSGNLPDSCTKLQNVESAREGNVFTVKFTTQRPNSNVACAQVLTPFEKTINLDVEGLPAGDYTVEAGDLTEKFVLERDNIPQEEPAACPEPQTGETRVEVLFREEGFGFCFLIPERFNQEKGGPDAEWIINGPNYGAEGSLPIRANLTVLLTLLNDVDLDTYIRQEKAYLDIPADYEQVEGTLGNRPAFIIDGFPLQSTSRIVWVGHDNQAFQLVFSPMEPALFPQATADMEMLYQLVMESWVFLGE